jgi:hypothetical protein
MRFIKNLAEALTYDVRVNGVDSNAESSWGSLGVNFGVQKATRPTLREFPMSGDGPVTLKTLRESGIPG